MFGIVRSNGTGTSDHTTTYGTGTSLVIVLIGFLLIFAVLGGPYLFGTRFYIPLPVAQGVPVVQGVRSVPVSFAAPARRGDESRSIVISPGGHIVSPDLSRLTPTSVGA